MDNNVISLTAVVALMIRDRSDQVISMALALEGRGFILIKEGGFRFSC